jgi:glycosyltransferase involved in cell wall biosynthesis
MIRPESSQANRYQSQSKILPRCDTDLPSHLVSVVIPAYNAEATINDTLRSVRSQTHPHLEIIVVDDGSADRTTSIVNAHAVSDGRITLISQKNAGVAAARNTGWQFARSALIAFVDADDLWAPTKIERQLEVILSGGLKMGLVYTWWALIDEHNRIRCKVRGRDIAGDVLEQTLTGNFVGHASSPLIRRQALVEAGGFDSGLQDAGIHGCEDLLVYHRIARRYQFGLVRDHLTGYRVASGRMSSDRPRMLRSFKMVANEMKLGHPKSAEKADRGVRMYLTFLIGEALASQNFRQALNLLALWVPEHPLDGVIIPFSVFCSKTSFHLQWLGKALLGHNFANERTPFPIGEVDLSTGGSVIDAGEFIKNH